MITVSRPKGNSDILYIRRLGPFLGVQNFEFQFFFFFFFFWGGGFRKKYIFFFFWGGVRGFCGYFWGAHHKIGPYLGVIYMHLRVFSKCQGLEWGIFFGVAEISNIVSVLEIPDIFFLMNVRCWARVYTYEEK